jgi:CBS domain-containing protein
MSTPPVTCDADASLAEAAGLMNSHDMGSVIVTDGPKVTGIVTERDLLRAAAGHADPLAEPVHLWMTANPDALDPE